MNLSYAPSMRKLLALPDRRVEKRAAILRLQDEAAKLPQVGADVLEEHFAPHVYSRTVRLSPGLYIGGTHRHEHITIVTGKCTVFTEFGEQEIDGHEVFKAPAGTKRAVLVHDRTTWTTIHPTEETDAEKIRAEVIMADLLLEAETS